MKIFQYTFFTIFLLVGQNAFAQNTQNQWKLISIIPEDSVSSVNFVFTDDLYGYLLAEKANYFAVTGFNNSTLPFYRTTDGGMTWQKIDYHNIFGPDTFMYTGNGSYFENVSMHVSSPNTIMFTNGSGNNSTPPNVDTLSFYWSENSGTSWQRYRTQPRGHVGQYHIETVPHDHEVIALDKNNYDGFNTGKFYISETNGVSFDQMRWDSTLLKNLSDGGFQDEMGAVNNHVFDYFDDSTWIISLSDSNNVHGTPNTSKPYSLVTLLTHDAGKSWQAYRNIIPDLPSGQESDYFDIQCVRGTPYVYLFDVIGAEGGVVYSKDPQNNGFPNFGIDFLYSSDYGETWNADSSFKDNRRGYEAVAPGEVWATITPRDSDKQTAPAGWIAHTLDNGKTWSIDSTSLYNDGFYDGRIVSFSGRNNGWIYAQRTDRKQIAIFKYSGTNAVKTDMFRFRTNTANEIYYTLYPNPATNEVTIHLTNKQQIISIDLFDILGRKLSCPYEIDGELSAHLHTDGLHSGCFLARITGQYGSYIAPFMIQH